ncbi:MAG TPA: hypothetical protein VJ558_08220, partial [Bacillales bacterium]|nr:hypothetical protein [Bacillales bacterium]
MPAFLEKKSNRYPFYGLLGVTVVLIIVLSLYNWILSLAGLLIIFLPIYYMIQIDRKHRKEVEEYITTLSYRVKRVGEEALLEMP